MEDLLKDKPSDKMKAICKTYGQNGPHSLVVVPNIADIDSPFWGLKAMFVPRRCNPIVQQPALTKITALQRHYLTMTMALTVALSLP